MNFTNMTQFASNLPVMALLSTDNPTLRSALQIYGPGLLLDGEFLPNSNLSDSGECVVGETEPHTEVHPFVRNITSMFNSPFAPTEFPTWNIALKVTMYVLAMILAIVGNLLVILTILLNKSMQNSTNLYLLNLAVSDLMVVFFCMWVHLGANITSDWPFGEFTCKVYPFFQSKCNSNTFVDKFTLLQYQVSSC